MKGDISRDSFDPGKGYSRVLQQQGRVTLDADLNESQAIYLHRERTVLADIIGPHGGPAGALGFAIRPHMRRGRVYDLHIGPGRYYVDGILCRNEPGNACGAQTSFVSYRNQPYRPHPARRSNDLLECPLLVYLDVWERHITYIEDPEIREPALGGADTATRSQVIWQVKLWPLPERWVEGAQAWPVFQAWRRIGPDFRIGCMRADVARPSGSGAGTVAPASPRFLGPENHLYRVEVHRVHPDRQELAFKWSRDNGSVAYPVSAVEGALVTLAPWASEDAIRLQAGDWVEIEDDRYALLGPEQVVVTEETLFRVAHVEPSTRQVRLQKAPPAAFGQNLDEHPLLRRWDQKGNEEQALVGGAVEVRLAEEGWHDLEYGVRIQFQATGEYQPGYYWQVPARYDSGTLLWPRTLDPESGEPVSQFRPPPGVHHHYAPLAIVTHDGEVVDCRRVFQPLAEAVLRQK
jgi:hypothetical protein